MYSASHVEDATNFCHFDCQAIVAWLQKVTKPDFERRVSSKDA